MKARFARWHATLAVGLFGRREGSTDAPTPRDAPFLSDAEPLDPEPATNALLLLARLIHEQTALSSWRDADFPERARSFLAARAVLEEMDAHHWLDPTLCHLPFVPEAGSGGRMKR
ncbi:hypothetical protein [Aquabacter cavernae]|uniref:hypothetical protein n=1 Tax=Aquabacter cavernae TaxID=2496029 RepID=UPI000F8E89CA|nr:hypothetical protein [Aquabacter cavernae]